MKGYGHELKKIFFCRQGIIVYLVFVLFSFALLSWQVQPSNLVMEQHKTNFLNYLDTYAGPISQQKMRQLQAEGNRFGALVKEQNDLNKALYAQHISQAEYVSKVALIEAELQKRPAYNVLAQRFMYAKNAPPGQRHVLYSNAWDYYFSLTQVFYPLVLALLYYIASVLPKEREAGMADIILTSQNGSISNARHKSCALFTVLLILLGSTIILKIGLAAYHFGFQQATAPAASLERFEFFTLALSLAQLGLIQAALALLAYSSITTLVLLLSCWTNSAGLIVGGGGALILLGSWLQEKLNPLRCLSPVSLLDKRSFEPAEQAVAAYQSYLLLLSFIFNLALVLVALLYFHKYWRNQLKLVGRRDRFTCKPKGVLKVGLCFLCLLSLSLLNSSCFAHTADRPLTSQANNQALVSLGANYYGVLMVDSEHNNLFQLSVGDGELQRRELWCNPFANDSLSDLSLHHSFDGRHLYYVLKHYKRELTSFGNLQYNPAAYEIRAYDLLEHNDSCLFYRGGTEPMLKELCLSDPQFYVYRETVYFLTTNGLMRVAPMGRAVLLNNTLTSGFFQDEYCYSRNLRGNPLIFNLNSEQVEVKTEIFTEQYFVQDDWLYGVSLIDNKRLCAFNLTTGAKRFLGEIHNMVPVAISPQYIYLRGKTVDFRSELWFAKLDGSELKLLTTINPLALVYALTAEGVLEVDGGGQIFHPIKEKR